MHDQRTRALSFLSLIEMKILRFHFAILLVLFPFVSYASLRNGKLSSSILPPSPAALTFAFLGDWGYVGQNQTMVANAMAKWVDARNASFVIALGDNFYSKFIVFQFTLMSKSLIGRSEWRYQ